MAEIIDKLAYICVKDRKVLVSLSKGKDTWYIPGGKREAGEDDFTALAREVREELSVDLIAETAIFYGVFEAQAHGKTAGTIVRMTCYRADYEGDLRPDNEIEKLDFLSFAEKSKTAPVDHLIFDDLKSKNLID